MSNDDHLVRFVDIQKSYDGESLVVKNLNLDVAKGEFLTMLGPSGSGKTTCLMMLAGFEPATHGEIYLKENPINKVPPHKRGIGMVFQNYALFPHMTVAENLAFPLEVRHMDKSEREQRVNRALDMVQLGAFGDRRPAQLSGGQQQRVAVARSLVFDPDLVLMDEPLGALDKNLREQMQYEIKHIHENLGLTVVYVTIIQQCAPPEVLYEQPENAFCANFIGENNRLLGKVVEDNGDTVRVDIDSDPGTVVAKKVNVEGVGSRSTLSLRPERVTVNPEAGSLPNFTVCGHDDFIVKIPNSAVHAHLKEGDTVNIGWNAEDCRALDPSD
jgi:putative spermidine/putrescine transport system ATP-binding protein